MSMEPRARSAQDRVDGCNAITTTEPGIVVTENEVAGELTTDDREHAIEQLLELGGAIDGLLAQQIELDIDALQQASGRPFADGERDEIRTHQRRAYRWTFLVSWLQHPNFARIVEQLTDGGSRKIASAARALAA